MADLPPDAARLRTIATWLDQQQADDPTIATYLDVQRNAVRGAIATTSPAPGYRLQPREGDGPAVLHRSDCPAAGGVALSPREARLALTDPALGVPVEPCRTCRPQDGLAG